MNNFQNTEYHNSTVVINGRGGRPAGGATSNAVVNAARRRGEVSQILCTFARGVFTLMYFAYVAVGYERDARGKKRERGMVNFHHE